MSLIVAEQTWPRPPPYSKSLHYIFIYGDADVCRRELTTNFKLHHPETEIITAKSTSARTFGYFCTRVCYPAMGSQNGYPGNRFSGNKIATHASRDYDPANCYAQTIITARCYARLSVTLRYPGHQCYRYLVRPIGIILLPRDAL